MSHRNMVWCLSGNVGDEIGPWLYEKMKGSRPLYTRPGQKIAHYVTCGSILNWSCDQSIVWGAGIASMSDDVPHSRILAVRGPLSKLKIMLSWKEMGNWDLPYGDPGLLVSRFYSPQIKKQHKFGFVPHYVDILNMYELMKDTNFEPKIINPLLPVERFIDDLLSCEYIFSSSLHGLILSDSYGIPNAMMTVDSAIGGDGMKYWDYMMSVGRASWNHYPRHIDLRSMSKSEIRKKEFWENMIHNMCEIGSNLESMKDTLHHLCPFN